MVKTKQRFRNPYKSTKPLNKQTWLNIKKLFSDLHIIYTQYIIMQLMWKEDTQYLNRIYDSITVINYVLYLQITSWIIQKNYFTFQKRKS